MSIPTGSSADGGVLVDLYTASTADVPIADKTIRPDGLALEVRGWGPASDRPRWERR